MAPAWRTPTTEIDAGPQQTGTTVTVAAPVSGTATHTLEFWSVDNAGNVETQHNTVTFGVAALPDTSPPLTSSNAAPSYVGTATITITATDGAAGSGVAHTYYVLDGAPAVEGTRVVVTPPGSGAATHTLQFYSIDNVGNIEAARPVPAFAFTVEAPPVDLTPPITSSDAVASYLSTATIHLTATDNPGGSGVAHTYYVLDGAPAVEGTVVVVAPPGSGTAAHTLQFYSVDKADNAEAAKPVPAFAFSVTADTAPPTTSSNVVPSYDGTATITITATDGAGGTGVARTYYILDGAPAVQGTTVVVPPPFSGAATHTLQFYSADRAGNVEAAKPVPAFAFSVSKPAVQYGTIVFRWDDPPWDAWADFYIDDQWVASGSQPGWDGWYIATVVVRPQPYSLSAYWWDSDYWDEPQWSYNDVWVDTPGKVVTWWY